MSRAEAPGLWDLASEVARADRVVLLMTPGVDVVPAADTFRRTRSAVGFGAPLLCTLSVDDLTDLTRSQVDGTPLAPGLAARLRTSEGAWSMFIDNHLRLSVKVSLRPEGVFEGFEAFFRSHVPEATLAPARSLLADAATTMESLAAAAFPGFAAASWDSFTRAGERARAAAHTAELFMLADRVVGGHATLADVLELPWHPDFGTHCGEVTLTQYEYSLPIAVVSALIDRERAWCRLDWHRTLNLVDPHGVPYAVPSLPRSLTAWAARRRLLDYRPVPTTLTWRTVLR